MFPFPNADQRINRRKKGGRQREKIPIQRMSAPSAVRHGDHNAAAEGHRDGRDFLPFEPFMKKEQISKGGKQHLRIHQHGGAGNGGMV